MKSVKVKTQEEIEYAHNLARLKKMVEVFKAFGDLTRLQLIGLLTGSKEKSFCVNELAQKLSVTQSAISQHLKILKAIGLVQPNRVGCHKYYTIDVAMLNEIKDDFNYLYSLAFCRCENIQGE